MDTRLRFATVAVSVDGGAGTAERIALAARIARRFDARLVGFAAQGIPVSAYAGGADGGYQVVLAAEEESARTHLAEAKALFHRSCGGAADWLERQCDPNAFALQHAGLADLTVLGRRGPADPNPGPMAVDAGAVAMKSGRPILVVPPGDRRDEARFALVAWNNSREARRALADALPFLTRAEEVQIVAIAQDSGGEGLTDAGTYLARHGVQARARYLPTYTGSIENEIFNQANAMGADLIVAGAYGHSRLREWFFGGITRSLLQFTPCPCLLSH